MAIYLLILVRHLLFQVLFDPIVATESDQSEYYAYCGPTITFCLYANGSVTDVKTLSDVDSLCKKASDKGRPIGLDQTQVEEELKEYLKDLTLPNVILNAAKKDEKWTWANDEKEITMSSTMKEKGELLIYETDSSAADKVYVICMTDCKASYEESPDQGGDTKDLVQSTGTVDACKLTCDQNKECEGFDMGEPDPNNCHLFLKKDIALEKKEKTTHYKIDRSVKTVLNCIGSIKTKSWTRSSEGGFGFLKDPFEIYLVIFFVVCAVAMIAYGVMKRMKKSSEDSSEE